MPTPLAGSRRFLMYSHTGLFISCSQKVLNFYHPQLFQNRHTFTLCTNKYYCSNLGYSLIKLIRGIRKCRLMYAGIVRSCWNWEVSICPKNNELALIGTSSLRSFLSYQSPLWKKLGGLKINKSFPPLQDNDGKTTLMQLAVNALPCLKGII